MFNLLFKSGIIKKVKTKSHNGSAKDCKSFGGGSIPPLVLYLFILKNEKK